MVYRYNYIEVPVKVNYKFGDNKLRLIAGAGIIAGVLTSSNQTVITEFRDGRTEEETYPGRDSYNKANISSLMSLGFDLSISDRLNLRMEPTFRYGVLEIMDTPVTTHLWSAGLNIGVYFGL